jgi:hypothetical protein
VSPDVLLRRALFRALGAARFLLFCFAVISFTALTVLQLQSHFPGLAKVVHWAAIIGLMTASVLVGARRLRNMLHFLAGEAVEHLEKPSSQVALRRATLAVAVTSFICWSLLLDYSEATLALHSGIDSGMLIAGTLLAFDYCLLILRSLTVRVEDLRNQAILSYDYYKVRERVFSKWFRPITFSSWIFAAIVLVTFWLSGFRPLLIFGIFFFLVGLRRLTDLDVVKRFQESGHYSKR